MAYVAMNGLPIIGDIIATFLNGVCRHEQIFPCFCSGHIFLNGVCRHEPGYDAAMSEIAFLNGVCRHEL